MSSSDASKSAAPTKDENLPPNKAIDDGVSVADAPPVVKSQDIKPAAAAATTTASSLVCRFRTAQLQGRRGYAKNDYYVDLVMSKHGLFHLVESVFGIFHAGTRSGFLQFHQTKFSYGWRDCPGVNYLDEQEPRLLQTLSLEDGQKGSFKGASAEFDFVVVDAAFEDIDAAKSESYPKITPIPNTITSELSDDWITKDMKQQCYCQSAKWKSYYEGENEWRRDRESPSYDWVLRQPIRPCWRNEECEIMGLLLNAGCKFKKSYRSILQYAFTDRSEAATSGEWYKLQREDYLREYYGRA
jgi:hypothetical protein